VRFGRRAGVGEYAGLLALAYAAPVVAVVIMHRPLLVLLPLATLPMAIRLTRTLATTEGKALNACLVATAKLLLFYGVLFALGLVVEIPR
jgi:1,4-dihydroxy-2-naphthoate octaprenyltransferase